MIPAPLYSLKLFANAVCRHCLTQTAAAVHLQRQTVFCRLQQCTQASDRQRVETIGKTQCLTQTGMIFLMIFQELGAQSMLKWGDRQHYKFKELNDQEFKERVEIFPEAQTAQWVTVTP